MPKEIETARSSLRREIAVACLLAAAVGLLGLLTHLAFSYESGELRYFHGAYDEDSYILSWLRGTLRSTRALSGTALSALYYACSSSLDVTLVASDFLFPFFATCAAYFAISQVSYGLRARILGTLLLVFAGDFFSLGSLVVWNSAQLNIVAFSRIIHLIAPNLVPAYETNFLSVFRTPEPQVSFTLMFLILGLLARLASAEHVTQRGLDVLLIVAIALLPFGYTFITAPIAAFVVGAIIVFATCRLKHATEVTVVGFVCAAGVALAAYSWQQGGGQTDSLVAGLSYPSRTPIVTPATIASVFLSVSFGVWLMRQERREPLAFLALGCLLLPFVLSNQQIISGVMISARDWERNVSYPLLVFGAVAAVSLAFPALETKLSSKIASVVCIGCLVVLLRAQWITFRTWEPTNVRSMTIVRALKAVAPALLSRARLTFEDVGISQLIQVRMNDSVDVPLSFYKVAMNLVPNMAAEATMAAPSPYESLVFEHWARTNTTPADAEKLLRMEIQQRVGTFANYLFGFRDAWYPASDNRAVRPVELERSLPSLIERYESFLRSARHQNFFLQPSLLISFKPPTQLQALPWLSNELIASDAVRGVNAYVYRQRVFQ